MNHYQLMQATAILRFWTLVFCLASFLDEHRARLQAERPEAHFTLGDARRDLQANHQRNLLTWLESELRSGATATADQLYARLFACLTIYTKCKDSQYVFLRIPRPKV